jgi:hypothetical protein
MKRRSSAWLSAPLLLLLGATDLGCRGKVAPEAGSTRPVSSIMAEPPSSAAAAVAQPAPARELPDPGLLHAVLLATHQGGTVELTVDGGGRVALADGSLVELTAPPDGMALPAGDWTHVSTGDKQGLVPAESAVNGVKKAPAGGFAVATAMVSCGDMCHSAVWLVHGMAERWRVFEHAVSADVAWHPRGGAVAIGGDGEMALIELPSGKVLQRSRRYFAPAYAPDGTLYVRDHDDGVLTLHGDDATMVGKSTPRQPVAGEYGMGPAPVDFAADGTWRRPAGEH